MPDMEQHPRWRKVSMPPDLLISIMTEGWKVPGKSGESIQCVKGLPEGAKFVKYEWGILNTLYLVVEHDSFEPLAERQRPPEHPVEFGWRSA